MRICLLTDEISEEFNPAPYMEGFDWEMVTMTDPVIQVLRALDARREFDVYLNICEGYEAGEEWEYQGIDVVKALEQLNLPYTGSTPAFFDPTREEMQAAADAHDQQGSGDIRSLSCDSQSQRYVHADAL